MGYCVEPDADPFYCGLIEDGEEGAMISSDGLPNPNAGHSTNSPQLATFLLSGVAVAAEPYRLDSILMLELRR